MPKASLAPPRLLFQIKSMLSPFLFLREGRSEPVVLEYCLLNANREVPAREPRYLQAAQQCPAPPWPPPALRLPAFLPFQALGN